LADSVFASAPIQGLSEPTSELNEVIQEKIGQQLIRTWPACAGTEFQDINMGIFDLVWQCIQPRGGESGNIITAPTLKMMGNIGH
jgi:hypothetical protein